MIAPELTFEELAENFGLFDDWEDRYRYLIDLGRKLPDFPEAFKTESYKVRGCMSQVWLVPGHPDGDPNRFAFAADSDAHIVKGLIAVLGSLYAGKTPEEIGRDRSGSGVSHAGPRSAPKSQPPQWVGVDGGKNQDFRARCVNPVGMRKVKNRLGRSRAPHYQ